MACYFLKYILKKKNFSHLTLQTYPNSRLCIWLARQKMLS
jgi:hypothetical protein